MDKEIIGYTVICLEDIYKLENNVNRLIKKQGFQPYGPMQIVGNPQTDKTVHFYQVLVKYLEPIEQEKD